MPLAPDPARGLKARIAPDGTISASGGWTTGSRSWSHAAASDQSTSSSLRPPGRPAARRGALSTPGSPGEYARPAHRGDQVPPQVHARIQHARQRARPAAVSGASRNISHRGYARRTNTRCLPRPAAVLQNHLRCLRTAVLERSRIQTTSVASHAQHARNTVPGSLLDPIVQVFCQPPSSFGMAARLSRCPRAREEQPSPLP